MLPVLKGEHLEQAQTNQPMQDFPLRQAPRFPHDWLKYLVHPETPTIIGWSIMVGSTGNQVL